MKKKVLVCLLTALLALTMLALPGKMSAVYAAGTVYYNNVMNVVVASDDGNCSFRTGPGLEYGVMQLIFNGTQLHITALTQNSSDGLVWGQTTYNGTTGWVSILTTAVYDVENASRAIYDVTVEMENYIYLRQGPGAEFPSLYRPYNGQVLRIDQTIVNSFDGRPWGRTVINGMQGWVSLNWTSRNNSWTYNQAQDVTFYDNQYYAVISLGDSATFFNAGPGYGYSLIEWIPNGASVYVSATLDNSADGKVWGQTYYDGSYGWIPMNDTRITGMDSAATAQYRVSVSNSSNLRLRSGPGTEYRELVSYIPNGTYLYITQTMINSFDGRPWGRTNYNGYDGWVSLNWTYRAPGT